MIPDEIKQYIKGLIAYEVNEKFKGLNATNEELKEEVKSLKDEIAILKEGGNI